MVVFFLPKKTKIYELHMKSRSKRRSDLLGRLLSKRVFLFKKDRAFYRAGMRLKKLYLLHQLNWHWKQNNTVYRHHHSVVIVILLDIDSCNVLIAVVTSFYIEMHFWGFKIDLFSDLDREVARSLTWPARLPTTLAEYEMRLGEC